jgi:large subunit ribosomal protein L19
VNNEGVGRIFPLHSPFVAKVIVRRSGETRRAKLFYLRDRVGKSVRLTESRKTKKGEAEAPAADAPALAGAAS